MNNIKFYAPGRSALTAFMKAFPRAGANMNGLVIDFEGLRGEPAVVLAALSYMLSNCWSVEVYDKLVYPGM